MNGASLLFKITFQKYLHLLRRYLFNSLMAVVGFYAIFALLFFAGGAVAPSTISNSIEGIVVGYFLWVMAVIAFQKTSSDLYREAQWGTLEQLYLSPYGIGRVVAMNSVVNLVGSFALGAVMLVSMVATTGTQFGLDVPTVLVVGVLTLCPPIGVGFLVGGLALVYKRVGQAASLVQLALLGLVAAPVDAHPLVRFLPMSLGSHLLQQSTAQGTTLVEYPPGTLLTLVVVAAAYLVTGYLALYRLQRVARVRGVLGHY